MAAVGALASPKFLAHVCRHPHVPIKGFPEPARVVHVSIKVFQGPGRWTAANRVSTNTRGENYRRDAAYQSVAIHLDTSTISYQLPDLRNLLYI